MEKISVSKTFHAEVISKGVDCIAVIHAVRAVPQTWRLYFRLRDSNNRYYQMPTFGSPQTPRSVAPWAVFCPSEGIPLNAKRHLS